MNDAVLFDLNPFRIYRNCLGKKVPTHWVYELIDISDVPH